MYENFFKRLLAVVMAAVVTFTIASCADDGTDDGGFRLYYKSLQNIGPSDAMDRESGAPSYMGGTPSDFAITDVTLDGVMFEWENYFAINSETGSIAIHNSKSLSTGLYSVSVECRAAGAKHHFRDAWQVKLIAAAPSEIVAEPSRVEVNYAALVDEATRGEEINRASSQITSTGESVSITAYELQQEEGKEYFAISSTGRISIDADYKGIVPPGIYKLDVLLQTAATGAEWVIFEDAVEYSITSKPLSLEYVPAVGMMEMTEPMFESDPVIMVGSPEDAAYSILKIEPETDKIQIDATTGAIKVVEGHGFNTVCDYLVSIKATNRYGVAEFENAYTLSVVNYIHPIENFGYDNVELMQTVATTITPKEGMVGDMVKFSFVELSDVLAQVMTIDANSGAITIAKGHTLPVGNHNIKVAAENTKGRVEARFTLTITENPYLFTYISYGNNLNLSPATNYASQYRFFSKSELTSTTLTPTTDIKEGVEVEWSVKNKSNTAPTIDPATGVITLGEGGWKERNVGVFFVTATTGKGTEAEVSMTVPVFFSYVPEADAIKVLYTPFVMQVNPRNGGLSAVPTIEGFDGDIAKFTLDYRRTFNYYNLNGPEEHASGNCKKPADDNRDYNTFLNLLWEKFYAEVDGTMAYDSRGPVSYYNQTKSKYTRDMALGYVDPSEGLAFRVNPLEWTLDGKSYANGVFSGQMTYMTDGTDPQGAAAPARIFPLWVWFDEKF